MFIVAAFPIIFACSHGLVSCEDLIPESNIDVVGIGRKLRLILQDAGLPKENLNRSQVVVPPNYMIALYHQYTEDKVPAHPNFMTAPATSVRCILGTVKRKSINFNLSSVLLKEEISHAEVHLFRRKLYHGKLPRIKFFLSQHRSRNFLPKKVASGITQLFPSIGWQTLNIDDATTATFGKWKQFVLKAEGLIPEFGEKRGRKTKYHSLSMEDLIRVAYRPFLLLFSQDSRPNLKLLSKEALVHGYDTKRDVGRESGEMEWGADYKTDFEMDNSLGPLSDGNEGLKRPNEVQSMGPPPSSHSLTRITTRKPAPRHKPTRTHHKIRTRNFGFHLNKDGDWSRGLFDVTDDRESEFGPVESRSENNKGRSKKKRVHRKLGRFGIVENMDGDRDVLAPNSICTLQHLSIPLDFSDRIIAPMSFPLNYCKGHCSNPKSRQKNRVPAISEFRLAEQLFPHISSPCCVPVEMKRVSILIVDKYNTIVLKSYANATVKSCRSY